MHVHNIYIYIFSRLRSCVLDIRGPLCLVDKCPSHNPFPQSVGVSHCAAFCLFRFFGLLLLSFRAQFSGCWLAGPPSFALMFVLEPKDALSDLTCGV